MLLRTIPALAFLIALLAVAPASAQTWSEYRPDGAGFRIEMPGPWTLGGQDVPTDLGPIKMHQAMVDQKTRVFLTIHSFFPQAHIDKNTPDSILDGARDGAVSNVKGKLLNEQRLVVGGQPSRHILVDTADSRISQRLTLSGNKLLQAIYVGPAGTETEADPVRYFKSFEIVK